MESVLELRKALELRRSENRKAYEADEKSYDDYSREEWKIDVRFERLLKR